MTALPHVLERASVERVLEEYARAFRLGWRGVPLPSGNILHLVSHGREWVLAEVPIDLLNFEAESEAGENRVRRARSYARREGAFPPGIAYYSGPKSKVRSGLAFVADGNHRTLAAFFRGDKTMRMWMPKLQYEAFVRDLRARPSR